MSNPLSEKTTSDRKTALNLAHAVIVAFIIGMAAMAWDTWWSYIVFGSLAAGLAFCAYKLSVTHADYRFAAGVHQEASANLEEAKRNVADATAAYQEWTA